MDLINRQAAIDAMAELQGRASSKGELTGISNAWKRIKKLPPIQPELTDEQVIEYCKKKGYKIVSDDLCALIHPEP